MVTTMSVSLPCHDLVIRMACTVAQAALVKEGTADLHEAAMEALLHAAFNSQA